MTLFAQSPHGPLQFYSAELERAVYDRQERHPRWYRLDGIDTTDSFWVTAFWFFS